MFNRRTLLSWSPSLVLPTLLYPTTSRAGSADKRKFLFVFCPGGWDQCYLFAPLFNSPFVDMEPEAQPASIGNLSFVDADSRPSVRHFFETYGDRSCMINGFEARSVAHDVCLRLVSTGSSQAGRNDWPSIIASHGSESLIMPSVHVSGPTFVHDYGHLVTQIGTNGQLESLLSGDAIGGTPSFDTKEDAWLDGILRQRTGDVMWEQAAPIESHLQDLQTRSLNLNPATDIENAMRLALELLSQNLSRTVMLGYNGVRELGWDTHAGNHMQGWHFEALFDALSETLGTVDSLTLPDGTPLREELCIVVLSEMGRFPKLNFRDGKDHWTYTSCLLIGAGVTGNRVIGGFDDYSMGKPVDLATGDLYGSGTPLESKHIGATLLALADIDPQEYLSTDPILGVIAP